MQKKILSLLLLFISINLYCQSKWTSKKDKIIIPFELTQNLIIVEVEINEVKLNMLLDTGSDKSLLFSFPENDTISFYETRRVKVNGLGNGETLEALVSNNNNFRIKDYIDEKFQILLITDQNINLVNKLGVPINGIVGASFFKDFLVEINYQRKKIILHRNTEKILLKKGKKHTAKDIEIIKDKPYLEVQSNLNGEGEIDFKLLIDTGLGDGLWLFENDSVKCSRKFIEDVLGRGLGGDIRGKKSRVGILNLNGFVLKEALVSYPDSLSFSQLDIVRGRDGSLGGGILKRFNWFLDYNNKKVYFKKNKLFKEPFNYNMSGIEVQHSGSTWVSEKVNYGNRESTYLNNPSATNNKVIVLDNSMKFNYKIELKPVFDIYAIRKNSPADLVGLKVGDRIISINGKRSFDFTIQKITDLFQSEEGKIIKIEIERDGIKMDFKFRLQKIL
ncbi:signal protein PDZ [Flavobacterium jejuense]|uniref:Signal protein PDZ n=1 Tax=Flavobacterium jejuense TaxID=1544455 RepID=A0ABX0IWG1_9FLAO|nr:PDZ domain-containing protein [Flavobacterium jejuense]NHN28157.1 signal protein PDZ [Flavobacterium jejuense]